MDLNRCVLINVLFFNSLSGQGLLVFILQNLSIGRKTIHKEIIFADECSSGIENGLLPTGVRHSQQCGFKPNK